MTGTGQLPPARFSACQPGRRNGPLVWVIAAALGCGVGGAGADPEADYRAGLKAYQAEDLMVAMRQLERAAQAGHGQAQTLLGYILDKAEDNEEAARYYRMAADQGNAEAAYWLGSLYATGEGIARDYEQAFHWFRFAADAGYGPAIEVVADAYLNGRLGQAQDSDEAQRWLQRGADQGYPPAQAKLGARSASKEGK